MIHILQLPDDLGAYAEARVMARVARAHAWDGSDSGRALVGCADALCARLGDVLHTSDTVDGLRMLRDAEQMVDGMRTELWRLLRARRLAARAFDDLMKATSRCRQEIGGLAARARQRAWLHLQRASAPAP